MNRELIQELIQAITIQEPSLIEACLRDGLTDEQIVKSYIADAMDENEDLSEDDIIATLITNI